MLDTRKQQMAKVKHLDRKVTAISANIEAQVTKHLADNLAEVVQFNQAFLETIREILTTKQQSDFFEVMNEKMQDLN